MAVNLSKNTAVNPLNNPWYRDTTQSNEPAQNPPSYVPSEKDMLEKYPDGTNVYSAPGVLAPRKYPYDILPKQANEINDNFDLIAPDTAGNPQVTLKQSTQDMIANAKITSECTESENEPPSTVSIIGTIILLLLVAAVFILLGWLIFSGEMFNLINKMFETSDLPPFVSDIAIMLPGVLFITTMFIFLIGLFKRIK